MLAQLCKDSRGGGVTRSNRIRLDLSTQAETELTGKATLAHNFDSLWCAEIASGNTDTLNTRHDLLIIDLSIRTESNPFADGVMVR